MEYLGVTAFFTGRPSLSGWLRSTLIALALWAATRAAFLMIGIYIFRLDGLPVPWADMWVHWDANYYLSIAIHGYLPPVVVTGLESGQSNINFFPLLPMLIRLVMIFGPTPLWAGLIAANICLIAACSLLHRLADSRFETPTADWSVLSLMVLPGSFELSSPMSESPFLLLSIAAAYLALIRNPAYAVCSSLLTITRWTGIIQGLGFALDWLIDRVTRQDADYRRLLPICLIPMPLFCFLVYMFFRTGDVLAPLHSNVAFWHQHFELPFQSLLLFLRTDKPRMEVQSALTLLFVILMLVQIRKFTPGEVFFVVASLASFTSSESASESLLRYSIGLYPLHLAVGGICSRSRAMRLLVLCLAMIGGVIASLWFKGSNVYI